jgi:GntR family uxuAB operon transcriptional repressor|tara:strand:- start:1893 stop:2588 length:696 start_codon:yes stop_codon:yes gene_type:complete
MSHPQTIDPPRIGQAAKLAHILRQEIFSDHYSNGQRLPSERQLAEDYSASRATVREALQSLERSNLVVRRRGSGTYVAYTAPHVEDDVAEITSPLQMMEVRCAVEPQMARLAILRMAARDIVELGEILDSLDEISRDKDLFTSLDQQFHMKIAEATRNPLMIDIYRRINHVRGHDQWKIMKNRTLTEGRISEYHTHHREIFEALQARDTERTSTAVNFHLDEARKDLMKGG